MSGRSFFVTFSIGRCPSFGIVGSVMTSSTLLESDCCQRAALACSSRWSCLNSSLTWIAISVLFLGLSCAGVRAAFESAACAFSVRSCPFCAAAATAVFLVFLRNSSGLGLACTGAVEDRSFRRLSINSAAVAGTAMDAADLLVTASDLVLSLRPFLLQGTCSP